MGNKLSNYIQSNNVILFPSAAEICNYGAIIITNITSKKLFSWLNIQYQIQYPAALPALPSGTVVYKPQG